MVQKQNRCYIQIGEKTETNVASSKSTGSGFGSNGTLAEHTTKSGIIIKVHGGDLTQLPVDVIVNGANTGLMHQGGLAGTLVKKGWLLLMLILPYDFHFTRYMQSKLIFIMIPW